MLLVPRLPGILVLLAASDRRACGRRLPCRRPRHARLRQERRAPQAIDQYTILHLVGDMVGILDALWGRRPPSSSGMIWGARVAWQAALMRPDRFRAVAALSVPFPPRGKAPPTSPMPRTENAQFYQLYFQEPGAAEAELGRDPRATIRNMLFGASGDGVRCGPRGRRSRRAPRRTSAWCRRAAASSQGPGRAQQPCRPGSTESDVDFYGEEFRRSGFRGALNYYRNIDRNWEMHGRDWPGAAGDGAGALRRGRSRLRGVRSSARTSCWPISKTLRSRHCAASRCFPVAVTGPSRSGRTRSTPRIIEFIRSLPS